MPWRTINGHKVKIDPKKGLSSADFPDPRNPRKVTTSTPFDDEYNRRRQKEFTQMKKEQFKKKEKLSKAQKKQARFHKVGSLNLGNARKFLILSTPVIVQLDPHLATIYTTWKFGKYGYGIYQKVKQEYDIKGNYNQALQKVVAQEIEDKVVSKIKSTPIKSISESAANSIWQYHKEKNPETSIPPEWDKFVVNAMTKTFEEIGGKI